MNLLLLEKEDFTAENVATISGSRLEHIHHILKAKQGDTLKAGMVNGKMGQAVITELVSNHAELEVTLTENPPTPLPLTVILALPRPKMLKRILSNIAEFGVKELYLINSYKVEKSFWQTPVLNDIDSFLKQGLAQAKDTVLPNVHCKKLFRPFVEDELPTIIGNQQAFVAHPYQAQSAPAPSAEPRVIVIGPEGGFIPFEIDLLTKAGCAPISLGERIYKVENALSLLCQQLSVSH
jgi:RsmE family RNA methyltransferase